MIKTVACNAFSETTVTSSLLGGPAHWLSVPTWQLRAVIFQTEKTGLSTGHREVSKGLLLWSPRCVPGPVLRA